MGTLFQISGQKTHPNSCLIFNQKDQTSKFLICHTQLKITIQNTVIRLLQNEEHITYSKNLVHQLLFHPGSVS